MANRVGTQREIRKYKHEEAEERNKNSAPDKRRAYWRERGFSRQSEAARLILNTVTEINSTAVSLRQRSEDWPIVPDLG